MWTLTRLAMLAMLAPAALPMLAYRQLVNWSLDHDEADQRYIY